MAENKSPAKRRPVRVLREDVARRIAAGEVIDRPAAIVRELMDNAVDSGAGSVSVEIRGGGITLVKVTDDGFGMDRDDLENCATPHATSKIVEADDLSTLSTLGFRGEALASIAAVSSLSVLSGNLKMSISNGGPRKIEGAAQFQGGKGTCVSASDLFSDFPPRRKFLKRPASETMACREIFVEKAMARPDISFRLTVDGEIRLDLPKTEKISKRLSDALEMREKSSSLHEISAGGREGDGKTPWSATIVLGEPSVRRGDRRSIFVYVNGRRIQEYSLIQAIEYGCQGFFPNGTHPVAALFASVDPALVDFNIHPAKREAKFKDISSLHHGVSVAVRSFYRSLSIPGAEEKAEGVLARNSAAVEFSRNHEVQNSEVREKFIGQFAGEKRGLKVADGGLSSRFLKFDTSREKMSADLPRTGESENRLFGGENPASPKNFRYVGRAMETFIMAEKGGILYFIDQHAAHERMIFDEMMEKSAGRGRQELLIPYTIETSDEASEKYVEGLLQRLDESGFSGKKRESGTFEFSTVPAYWKGTQEDLRAALLDDMAEPERILYKIFASCACRRAVMQGTEISDDTAKKIAGAALDLPDPHCPHGRPVWFTMTKEQMFSRVRRTE